MAWQPEPRPDWVLAVNAGDVSPITEVAALPLDRDALLAEARATLGMDGRGVDGFGSDEFLEPLDVLLPALEKEAELSVIGRFLTRRFLLRLLEVRAQTVAYVRDDPGVVDEEILEPVFVAGAPRTGTTILHALLAQDASVRVPEGWELLRPVPPPNPADVPRPGARRARRPRAARDGIGHVPPRRDPRIQRAHAQGVRVVDVVRVPVGGVHRARITCRRTWRGSLRAT